MSENNTESFKNLLIILAAVFSIFLFTVILIFSFSDFAFLNPKGLEIEKRLQYGISAVTTTGTIFAGIAVFFNAYQASRSANAANENAKAVYKNAQAAEDKQITERFSKAIELLGNQQIEVKLGGIYALEQIAKDAPEKYHWTIMEVLTAFVRENAPLKKEGEEKEIQKYWTAIQAALTVIGRRNCEHEKENQRLDLTFIDIREANFDRAKNLTRIDLYCSNLDRASFQEASLQDVSLWSSSLQSVNFSEAMLERVNLAGAKLCQAKFNKANLKESFPLDSTDLHLANLFQANLQKVNLSKAKNLELNQIESANIDQDTKLPDHIEEVIRCEW
ncbi:pentapeptide repeat-containing protein [Anabaena cylindrica FACHB-243]|uniref:Pentapeptide repeat protein n=1 Tax=Anabaena cylindrica (strain ATCC 27899 / PCC 7122) TaxID=272123 RepID=K9ZL17_ANACC|nr:MULTISPECIES: pentapeptide repeat-containing protein [Anabaena]AFZ59030.1 pentapeptide repeat protein [Anabaena cylindrica PCC 7122]MBD2420630.1 pentapeptide repeat-containing protein [Anabaena cylindrica FACHB-243]MBY5283826.1 pentapeptide repeat-containing protein [Anabaena sp. CCAP 1446/1C]MBY5309740.1 pentapeptide repeat-containing protein [Anabaena sp. CCAP 1446/1C]MCM2408590.1 pentapeptide repeat-containing protein [Anabaena sp. CCAP 1446/1C]